MSRRSQTRNQYEATSTGEMPAGGFSLTVDSTAGFEIDEPIYLAIEPDVPGQREWVRVISITGNTFNIDPSPNDHGSDGRNLAGSDGDLTHPSGSKVRSVTTEQMMLDVFQDIEDNELADTQHATDGGDPHANAGYLQTADGDVRYVRLDADTTLDALVTISTPETTGFVDADLVPKVFVDDADASTLAAANAFSTGLDHDHATPIGVHAGNPDVHHVAFVEGDADLLYLPLDGAVPMAANLPMGGFKVTGLVAGTLTGDAARFDEVDALEVRIATLEGQVADLIIDVDALEVAPPAHTHAGTDVTSVIGVSEVPNLPTSKVTSGEFAVARIPDLAASKITSGSFPGSYSVLGSFGVALDFNANQSVDFSGLAVDAGATVLRISGNGVRRSA